MHGLKVDNLLPKAKVLLPVTHGVDGKKPIRSIDINPTGTLLATGGENWFKIWDLTAIQSQQQDNILLFEKFVEGDIKSVRWSHSGKYLATGIAASTNSIKIWETNENEWKDTRTFRLRKDITGLCWSPDDDFIAASSSVDNDLIIWSITERGIRSVIGDTECIKSVAWDPIGKYVATYNGKEVHLWRTDSWKKEHIIEQPSIEHTDFIFNLDWSPDGSHLILCKELNSGKSIVIISRGRWQDTKLQELHGCSSTSTLKCTSNLFSRSSSKTLSYCAVGSQEGKISVWTVTAVSPRTVSTIGFFNTSVQDITWNPDGKTLFACSSNGVVAMTQFTKKDFGNSLTPDEMIAKLKQKYGPTIGSNSRVGNLLAQQTSQTSPNTIKSPSNVDHEIISVEDDEETDDGDDACDIDVDVEMKDVTLLSDPSSPKITQQVTTLATYTFPKQEETIKTDGKRRITPELLPTHVTKDIPRQPHLITPFAAPAVAPTVAPTAPTPQKEKVAGKKRKRTKKSKSPPPATAAPPPVPLSIKSGKKRITPQKITTSSTSTPTTTHNPAVKKRKLNHNSPKSSPLKPQVAPVNKPFRLKLPNDVEQLKYHLTDTDSMPLVLTTSVVRSQDKDRGILKCDKSGKPLWRQLVEGKPSLLTGTDYFCALACKKGYLHIFSTKGQRLLPSISLGSSISYLDCDIRDKLLAITSAGKLYIWDIRTQLNLFTRSIKPILQFPGTTIKRARLSEQGIPIITISTGECFTLHPVLKTWVSVSSASSTRYQSVFQTNSRSFGASTNSLLSLPTEETSSSQLQEIENLSHLNNQVVCALALCSRGEYKHWLLVFVRKLTEKSNEGILRDICQELHEQPPNTKILGFSCDFLLDEILQIISNNQSLKPLVDQYTKQYSSLSSI